VSKEISIYYGEAVSVLNMTQIHKKMTMDANFEGSSEKAKEDLINRRNGQGPKHLKFFLFFFLKLGPSLSPNSGLSPTHDFIIHNASEEY